MRRPWRILGCQLWYDYTHMTASHRISVLKSLKQRTLTAATRSGLMSLARDSGWRGRRLLILAYHGVSASDEHEWDGSLYIPPTLLRARFTALRDGGYRVLPLDEAVRRLYDGSLPPRAVAITFDDGAADFYSQARPLLEEFGYPATVYLTSYYALYQRPVFNTMLRYVLWKARGTPLDASGFIESTGPLSTQDGTDREAIFQSVLRTCVDRGLSGADKDAIITALAGRLGLDYDSIIARRTLCIMSADEVGSLPKDLIDVQLHTHRHRVPVDRGSFVREIDENRAAIASMTGGAPAVHFCYPSGVTHRSFASWLTESGVVSATTTLPGIASQHSDPLMLPRLVDTVHVSPVEFEGWLTGTSAFLPRRAVRPVAPLT